MINFDTIIIGGGLTGLICGIDLSLKGQRCAIISSGQSALHFSSGSFDLLNRLPDGKPVKSPVDSVSELIAACPEHPYAKMGNANFAALSETAKDILNKAGVPVKGSAHENHYRMTPLGTLKPTWLTLSDFPAYADNDSFRYKSVTIFNIAGFLDFYPLFIADELKKFGTDSHVVSFSIPDLDNLRRNPSEMRSTNIARLLDKKENTAQLAKILRENSSRTEAVIFPAVIGISDNGTFNRLQNELDKPLLLMPTFPPSVGGIRSQQTLQRFFVKSGGTFLLGDKVNKAVMEDNKVNRIYSSNHGDMPFAAKNYVLATGSYFSNGLVSTHEKVLEPIFDLDVSFRDDRQGWYDENIFNKQQYQSFGVRTDASFRGLIDGQAVDNLYVAGAVLEGFNPIKEGSGGGVSLLSALHVSESILKEGRK